MRVAIITQPLMENYGGLLQNFALQRVVKRLLPEADVITFDQVDSLAPWYYRTGAYVKRFLRKKSEQKSPVSDFEQFIERYIRRTKKAKSYADFKRFDRKYTPDVYIVGSDQVWRPRMVFNLKANFLAFTGSPNKIAYAASFGVDSWEFSDEETEMCRRCVGQFKSISVREKSAISLCRDYLNVDAKLVLDPTLLLSRTEYEQLLSKDAAMCNDYIFTYILDSTPEKRRIVGNIMHSFDAMEINAAHDVKGVLPAEKLSVEAWLSGIKNARMVVCDSFHGVVFSTIFHKNFFVIANPERGNTRISSLLEALGLTDRLISPDTAIADVAPIDWNEVEQNRQALADISLDFLTQALCNR